MSRRPSLLALLTAAAVSACGGGSPPSNPGSPPSSIVLLSPDAGATLNGPTTIQVEAISSYSTVKRLQFDAPEDLKSATPTLDPENQRATLTGTFNTANHPDGRLTVTVTAETETGVVTTKDFEFQVSSTARVVSLDANLRSFRDEAAMTVDASVPPQYGFGSAPAVAIAPGSTIHKAATRLSWDAQPRAADLEGTNPTNTPTLRVLVSKPANMPAITEAKATVSIQCAGCSIPTKTIDMWPASVSPSSASAYLIPLDGHLFPLGQVPGTATLDVSVSAKDAVGHTASGGPWTISLLVVGPPLAISEDTAYRATTDSRAVYAYQNDVLLYSKLWETSPFTDDAVRLLHFVIQNPTSSPVAVGPSLTSGAWSMTETWNETGQSISHAYSTDDAACAPKDDPPCPNDAWATYAKQDYTSAVTCEAGNYSSYPTDRKYSGVTGRLVLHAYKGGTTTPADVNGAGRLIVPAASGGAAGALDLYVGRSVYSPRPTVWPELQYNASSGRHRVFVLRALRYSNQSYGDCSSSSGGYVQYRYANWTGYDYWQTLSEARETIAGTLTFVTRGVAGTDEVGAQTTAATVNIARDIVH